MPALSFDQTTRFLRTMSFFRPAFVSSVRCRQSMKTNRMAPSLEQDLAEHRNEDKKSVNSLSDISPDAIANSWCLTFPSPETWPSMGTLNGGSVSTTSAV